MYRKRRSSRREIAFSFDSFLDLVANVIGIIIRLILVAWVGARAYQAAMEKEALEKTGTKESTFASTQPKTLPQDPLQRQLDIERAELEQARADMLSKLKALDSIKEDEDKVRLELKQISLAEAGLERDRLALEEAARNKTPIKADFTMSELRQRSQEIIKQIQAVEKLPTLKKTLRYHTPVSRPVHTDELMFECRRGRVTYIDLPAFMAEVKQNLQDLGQQLRNQWQVSAVAGPVGAFRLHYVVERQRDLFTSAIGGNFPTSSGFSYGLSEWALEPVQPVRGEPLPHALAPGSEFRRIIEAGVPQQTVVTFWVYADSFGIFRELRDFLYERGLEVAGRPMPDDAVMAANRHGTKSRGQ
jgi:hypothetical protein